MEELVLKNGINFKSIIPLPADIKKGKVGHCFKNAFEAVQDNKRKYHYCEGYATRGNLVCLHAWVVNRNYEVIDPTWQNGKDYYGIIFKFSYVWDWMSKNKKFISLIDNWKEGWPLLKEPPKKLLKNMIVPKRIIK